MVTCSDPAWGARATRAAPLVTVLLAFAAAALVIPTMTAVTLNDDWVYTRSVEILLRQHQYRVLDVATASVGFQVVWGALFAWVFGLSLGALRLSTVVMSALGGVAVYGVCRELGADRPRSALGSALFLFNPLALALAYSFMTDTHYVALMAIATYGYIRGLVQRSAAWTLFGSVAAALALLVRQQGVLLPLAVVAWLLLMRRHKGRLRLNIGLVMAGPILIGATYHFLLPTPGGSAGAQGRMVAEVGRAGVGGIGTLAAEMVFIALMYAAFFAAPLVISALPAAVGAVLNWGWGRWLGAAVGALVLTLGLAHFAPSHMPYSPHFMGGWGLGPNDLVTGRHPIFQRGTLVLATFVCAGLALGLVVMLLNAIHGGSPGATLVLVLGVTQFLGAIPPSIYFRDWKVDGIHSPSIDRYLLPLLPCTIWLAVWASRRLRTSMIPAALLTALMAVAAIVGTRDNLAWQQQVWDMAAGARRAGVSLAAIDAGAAWDGYHIGEETLASGVPVHTPGGKWWLYLFSPRVDSTYVVSMRPEPGYDVVTMRPYRPWLRPRGETMYLLRRHG